MEPHPLIVTIRDDIMVILGSSSFPTILLPRSLGILLAFGYLGMKEGQRKWKLL